LEGGAWRHNFYAIHAFEDHHGSRHEDNALVTFVTLTTTAHFILNHCVMTKSKSVKEKVRFDGLDVAAIVTQLSSLTGRRIVNIYDGVSDADSFLIKLDGTQGKTMVFLESGIRIHVTNQPSLQQEGMPSPFCSKLRKHLRGLRLERISQLGNYDRVVHLVFGTGEKRCSVILELYARGNLILTNSSYEILALLRSHDYQDAAVQVKVGQVYPLTYATSVASSNKEESKGLMAMNGTEAIAWATTTLAPNETTETKKKKKGDPGIPLKALLLKPFSGVSYYGPALLEDCILCANLDPNVKLTPQNVANVLSASDWDTLIASLKEEGPRIMNELSTVESKGYILYREKPESSSSDKTNPSNVFSDKILEEFLPHLLKQHEGRPFLEYDNFSQAVDEFFAHIGSQNQVLRSEAAEVAAKDKLEKVRKDIQNRIDSLTKEQEKLKHHAQLVEFHAEDVDKALGVINSALNSGMDWDALEALVETEQANQNPIALLISRLDLEKDAMVLALPDKFANDSGDQIVNVTVSLGETAHGNASVMFAKYRAAKEKSEKTADASGKALKAAEAAAQRELENAKKKSKLTIEVGQKRKAHWFEKFHWMITSDNYLVVGGKDAQQNEMLVKRYLRPGDAYLHADVHGASSCILRAKRRRKKDGRTEPIPLPEQALREAGTFTICHSSAWSSRMVTSAWWVESNQVSKTAPSGEYLTVGSFMVRGKKNYLPPSQLELGLGVLFRLGDEDSIARHKNERRDFSILSTDDTGDTDDEMATIAKTTASKPKERRAGSPVPAEQENESMTDAPESDLASERDESQEDDLESTIQMEKEEEKMASGNAEQNEKASEQSASPAKKGLSVKERKLIKKYGSLEAAEKATVDREAKEEAIAKDSTPEPKAPVQNRAELKRGKKSKKKRAAKRYADQDDEDRELALLALHAGEKKDKKKSGRNTDVPVSAEQEKVAAETAALLVKDPEKVAEQLPDRVCQILSECITVQDPAGDESNSTTLRWDKFDSDILEQLTEMESLDEQLAAAKRLLFLKSTTRVDNFSASLAGIIRTIRKHGYDNLQMDLDAFADDTNADAKRKTKLAKEAEDVAWKATLAEEGIVDEDLDQDAIDDTIEISKLTGKPQAEDSILYAVPVCAPYQSLSQYKYRVKLTPGNQKRGKAAKQCVEILTKPDGDKTTNGERCRELIKHVSDNDWIQTICADVKISSAGAGKMAKKQKANGKKGKKNKK
jgi:predicted ribosome quality control (RQC) complex YloA/Tae2 family protein